MEYLNGIKLVRNGRRRRWRASIPGRPDSAGDWCPRGERVAQVLALR